MPPSNPSVYQELHNFLLSIDSCDYQQISTHQIQLPMTQEGWRQNRSLFPKVRGIYILTGQYNEKEIVFRIGMAAGKRGIFGRWFETLSSHYTAWTKPQNRTMCYHVFYSQMAELCQVVTLDFLLIPHHSKDQIRHFEQKLIEHFNPIWEQKIFDQNIGFKETDFKKSGQALKLKYILDQR